MRSGANANLSVDAVPRPRNAPLAIVTRPHTPAVSSTAYIAGEGGWAITAVMRQPYRPPPHRPPDCVASIRTPKPTPPERS